MSQRARWIVIAILALSPTLHPRPAQPAERPNILWITAEDMSPTLGCYGDEYATTPHIDALARESVRYTHAFATAPVCSPSRACLINGCIAVAQGTHPMRSTFPIPEPMIGFPARLRAAGYYTSNNVKTDYNSAHADQITARSWNDCSETAHWRNRSSDQPFFAVFNLMTSHQSRTMVWPYQQFQDEVQSQLKPSQVHDPASVPLPPYYPDTPVVRKTLARYYDCVTAMDQQVQALLDQLQSDGLADDTIVFFYSDHGSGMPRHKRALLDSGMHVPLLIRFPERFRDHASGPPGTTTDRLVSFDDFGPTVLSLAGVPQPPHRMTGKPFLGEQRTEPREYVFGHRDRVDEIIDMARSIRDHRYLYIRNFMPHLGYNQPGAWIDQGEIRHEFYRLAQAGKMSPAQWHFAGPTRAREELYDCQADPQNLQNLANSTQHQAILQRMRGRLRTAIHETRDLGFLPETEQWKVAQSQPPMSWAETPAYQLDTILGAAERVGLESQAEFRAGLQHQQAAVRYWSALGYSAADQLLDPDSAALKTALSDSAAVVRIEAANALARHQMLSEALPVLIELLQHDDLTVVLYAARTIERLGASARSARAAMQELFDRHADQPGDLSWFIRFTTTGFLSRLEVEK